MLALQEIITDTHDDYEQWADCLVGFDDDGSFVVRYNYTDYSDHENDHTLDACVTKEQALMLAQKLHVHLVGLPKHFERKFETELSKLTAAEVKDIFEEMLAYISSFKVHFKLRRLALQDDF